jgi:hypothetical protein
MKPLPIYKSPLPSASCLLEQIRPLAVDFPTTIYFSLLHQSFIDFHPILKAPLRKLEPGTEMLKGIGYM